jgi:hypothetical protein
LREAVRAHGDINRFTISCPPVTGLREVVKFTSLTVEGSITVVESALHEDDRDGMPGAIGPSPFVVDDPLSRAGATATRVRLRVSNQGRVIVDGGSITERSGFPALRVGQHVIVSAYFNRDVGQWVPFGVFEVREGRVIHLDRRHWPIRRPHPLAEYRRGVHIRRSPANCLVDVPAPPLRRAHDMELVASLSIEV